LRGPTAMALAATLAALAAPTAAEPPRSPVHVDADEVQYHYKDRKVVFLGKPLVRLTREDAVLTCRRLVADNDEQGRIRRAVCTGDVKLTRGERVATCQSATFEEATSRVVCSGSPVLRDGQSVMTGERLTYDLAEDRVVLSQAKGSVVPPPGEGPIPRARRSEGPP
jgi:lipopolysaccharide export system protein LptA